MRYVTEIKENTTIGTYSFVSTPDFFELLHGLMLPFSNEREWEQVRAAFQVRDGTAYQDLIEEFGVMSLGETQVATQLPLSDLDQLCLSTLEAVLKRVPWYIADRRPSVSSKNRSPLPCPMSLNATKSFFNLRTLN